MPALTRNIAPIASQLAAMLVLLLPAIWNRFPLLEYDTGGYLARWFEGTLVPSRSTTYGLFLAPGSPFDFWPVVILQAAAAVWIVGVMLKIYRLDFRPAGLLAIVSLLSATTALPFLASELLTDIFAGLALLALHALVWHGERIEPRRCAALVVFIAFAASTHSATFAVLLVLGVAALLCWLFKRPLLPGAAVVLGGVLLMIATGRHVALFGAILAAAGGAWFTLGTMLSPLWNNQVTLGGSPASSTVFMRIMEQLGFFSALGVVIVFIAGAAFGRILSVASGIQAVETVPPTPPAETVPIEKVPARTGPTITLPFRRARSEDTQTIG